MDPEHREELIVEVVQRVLDRQARDDRSAEQALFDTVYHERRRLEHRPDGHGPEASFYDRVYSEAVKAAPGRHRELLREVIQRFANEVDGHFDRRVYAMATKAVPVALNVLLNTLSPLRLVQTIQARLAGSADVVDDIGLAGQIEISGHTEHVKRLARIGTTILVPTHSSNLDSVLIGFALHQLGLPPYTYGAGLNLFANPVVGFFIGHLGAYTVDRRKTAPTYKEVLKTYAGATMETGYHNLFFPGGTRGRSGAIEQKLKLGLLGMGLDAYINNLLAGKRRPDIFVVPTTINYQLVLEAETLIDDHLKATGKSRYIIEDDEFSRPRRILDFMTKLFSLHSKIDIVVSRPMDVFGNMVDDEGRSLDPKGRIIDRSRYVLTNDILGHEPQRDREYTRELARSVGEAFHRDTLIKSTNLVSYAAFQAQKQKNPKTGLYRLLRSSTERSVPIKNLYRHVEQTHNRVLDLAQAGKVRIDETVRSHDAVAIVGEALAHLGSYHSKPAVVRRADRLLYPDPKLVLYYGNRLSGFGLDELEA